jgi:NAD-dependent deacetylase
MDNEADEIEQQMRGACAGWAIGPHRGVVAPECAPVSPRADPTDDALALAQSFLRNAQNVLVLTGAGISTESGIPDFRGPQGVWTRDPDAEKLSDIRYYLSDPEIRKKAWRSRLDSPVWGARPNAGHAALVALEQRGKLAGIITQNIDGLHQIAGSRPERVVEMHGTVRNARCMSCSYYVPMEVVAERLDAGEPDPDCPDCGGILKSATISFGQSLVFEDLMRAETLARECDLLLALGSTLSVYPVAAVVPTAKQAGARIVIVNAEPTEMDALADAILRGNIGELLPKIVAGTN